jgi:hypothetical protein
MYRLVQFSNTRHVVLTIVYFNIDSVIWIQFIYSPKIMYNKSVSLIFILYVQVNITMHKWVSVTVVLWPAGYYNYSLLHVLHMGNRENPRHSAEMCCEKYATQIYTHTNLLIISNIILHQQMVEIHLPIIRLDFFFSFVPSCPEIIGIIKLKRNKEIRR